MNDPLGYLISDTSRMMRKAFDERARQIGVTRPQWRLLAQLNRQPGSKQAPLAELLEVEPITLSRMVDRLQEAGLVERRPDPLDRRAWSLFLTDKARPLIDNIKSIADDLHDDALAGIPEAQIEQFRETLDLMRANLSQRCNARKAAANG